MTAPVGRDGDPFRLPVLAMHIRHVCTVEFINEDLADPVLVS